MRLKIPLVKILLLMLFFNNIVSAATSSAKSKTARSMEPSSPPSSNVPGTGYIPNCRVTDINTPNIKSFTVAGREVLVENSSVLAPLEVPNNAKISVNCASDYYVFEPERPSNSNIKQSFDMVCDKGLFKPVKPGEYCDEKCNISPLAAQGYIIPKDILSPGEKITISCPEGQTTRTGKNFQVSCMQNGMLNYVNPSCFTERFSCLFNGFILPESSNLTCAGAGNTGLVFVTCIESEWEDKATYNQVKNSCKESIQDVEFVYEDLNQIIILAIDDSLTIEEIIDFCLENPQDPGCHATLSDCIYNNTRYKFGHNLVLFCPNVSAEIKYSCAQDWLFAGFKDSSNPMAAYSYIGMEQCGKNSYITESIPPENTLGRSNTLNAPKTLKDYKKAKFKETMQQSNTRTK